MRSSVFLILAIILLASCSSPKHTYYFNHYDYNSGKKVHPVDSNVRTVSSPVENYPLTLDPKKLTASTDKKNIAVTTGEGVVIKEDPTGASAKTAIRRNKEMSRDQAKEFRKAMRADLKKYVIPKKGRKCDSVKPPK